jgi:arginase family enzyme
LFPGVLFEPGPGGQVRIENPTIGTAVRVSERIVERLRKCESEFIAPSALGLDHEEVRALSEAFVIVDEERLRLTRHGLVEPTTPCIGRLATISEVVHRLKHSWITIGVALDHGGTYSDGARHGPTEIRQLCPLLNRRTKLSERELNEGVLLDFDRRREYALADIQVADLGNLFLAPGESVEDAGRRLSLAAELVRRAESRPLVLGGDQSISKFMIRSLLSVETELAILHFDAHHDLYDVSVGHHHGNAFREALFDERVRSMRQIGLRTFEIARRDVSTVTRGKLSYRSAREANTMSPEEVLSGLPRDLPYFLSFDIDCLSPAIAPETGTPEAGGIMFDRCLDIVDCATTQLNVVGADIVEVRRDRAIQNLAARAAAQVLMRVLLGNVRFRPLEDQYGSASWA